MLPTVNPNSMEVCAAARWNRCKDDDSAVKELFQLKERVTTTVIEFISCLIIAFEGGWILGFFLLGGQNSVNSEFLTI